MLTLAPITLRLANDFVEAHHRHSARTTRNGGKWAVAVIDGANLAAECKAGGWNRDKRERKHQAVYDVDKFRWEVLTSDPLTDVNAALAYKPMPQDEEPNLFSECDHERPAEADDDGTEPA